MKRILYLTFYFEPDLCAGSFRNTPLAVELASQVRGLAEVEVMTTLPNRYSTYHIDALPYEQRENLQIHRFGLPLHQSGFKDQILSFRAFYSQALYKAEEKKYDLIFASSSRLFTAYLGYKIAKNQRAPLYLDIRDIFLDTMSDVVENRILKAGLLPVLKRIESRSFNYATHINLISGGFQAYFSNYKRPRYSFYSNGIDREFLKGQPALNGHNGVKTITYAGNIGAGQGLHKIVPQAAKELGDGFRFLIIGDGGAKGKLLDAIEACGAKNIEIHEPVSRHVLLKIYADSDYLFLHLNDFEAFKKVLPSKIFELGAYDQPIIAGVGGYAHTFIKDNLENVILFNPCDADAMVRKLRDTPYLTMHRKNFINRFKRDNINREMAASIASYL